MWSFNLICEVFVGRIQYRLCILFGVCALVCRNKTVAMALAELYRSQFGLNLSNIAFLISVNIRISSCARINRSILIVAVYTTSHPEVRHLILNRGQTLWLATACLHTVSHRLNFVCWVMHRRMLPEYKMSASEFINMGFALLLSHESTRKGLTLANLLFQSNICHKIK